MCQFTAEFINLLPYQYYPSLYVPMIYVIHHLNLSAKDGVGGISDSIELLWGTKKFIIRLVGFIIEVKKKVCLDFFSFVVKFSLSTYKFCVSLMS